MNAKIGDFETNSKIKISEILYRDTNDVKIHYEPRINTVKGGNGDMITDSQSILGWWRKHFSQLFSIMGLVMLGKQLYT